MTKSENIRFRPQAYFRLLVLASLLIATCTIGNTQDHPLHQINQQVYANFSKAFDQADIALFKSIHSKDLIRIGSWSQRIRHFDEYMEGYEKRWSNPNFKPSAIEFRFLERIYSDTLASERGIYKTTSNKNTPQEKSSYGKFHVLLIKEDGKWKFLMDYDSNEGNTIDENSYQAAYPIDDVKRFIRKQ